MSDQDLMEDSQISASDNELSEPDPPSPEVPLQQHQPEVDLANELPSWYEEFGMNETLTQREREVDTNTSHRHRRKRSRLMECSSESSTPNSDDESLPISRKKSQSSNDELKSLIKMLFKKVEKNEKLLEDLIRRYMVY
jgi:hypothetical protein